MMKKRFLAAAAALLLSFTAGIPTLGNMSAYADNGYGEIYDIDDDYYDSGQGEILDSDYDYQGYGNAEEVTQEDGYETYDQYQTTARQANPALTILICIGIGLLIGLIVTGSMMASMKSVRKQTGAADYKDRTGIKLNVRRDDFLYNRIEKTPIAQPRQQGTPGQGNTQHRP